MTTIGRRGFLKGTAAATAAMLGGVESKAAAAAEARPNVVVILTDDQRWDCMSCAGHPFLKTPHMDRVASEGALFENAFTTTSLCSPSRASMFSGLYAHTHKVVNNFTDFPADLPNYPRQLHNAGYETAYIGKWHMGEDDDSARPGYDYWASHKGQGDYYDTTFNINGEHKVLEGYYTTRVTDVAVDWLKQPKTKPFLMILGHKAPHTPFTPEEKYKEVYDHLDFPYPDSAFDLEGKPQWIEDRLDTWHGIYGPVYGFRKEFPDRSRESMKYFEDFMRAYHATILSVDDSVGRVYDALKETGVLDNTLLIFASDNGMYLGEHGMTDKRGMHEGSIRVPLLARYPKLIKPGTKVAGMVLNQDLAPSILDICGAPGLGDIHGRSWKGLLDDTETNWRKSWYYEYNFEDQFPYTPNVRGVRTDDWKYIRYPEGGDQPDKHMAELYNLREDPEELKNLVNDPAHAGKVAELRAELHRLMDETGAFPDEMPLNPQMRTELPEASIR